MIGSKRWRPFLWTQAGALLSCNSEACSSSFMPLRRCPLLLRPLSEARQSNRRDEDAVGDISVHESVEHQENENGPRSIAAPTADAVNTSRREIMVALPEG